jgi:hypothetical protein
VAPLSGLPKIYDSGDVKCILISQARLFTHKRYSPPVLEILNFAFMVSGAF